MTPPRAEPKKDDVDPDKDPDKAKPPMTDKARALQEKKQKLAAKKELRASGDAAQAASATPPESPGKTDKALALERKKADLAARKAARASGSNAEAPAPAAAAAPPESPGSSNFLKFVPPLKTFFLFQNIFSRQARPTRLWLWSGRRLIWPRGKPHVLLDRTQRLQHQVRTLG